MKQLADVLNESLNINESGSMQSDVEKILNEQDRLKNELSTLRSNADAIIAKSFRNARKSGKLIKANGRMWMKIPEMNLTNTGERTNTFLVNVISEGWLFGRLNQEGDYIEVSMWGNDCVHPELELAKVADQLK